MKKLTILFLLLAAFVSTTVAQKTLTNLDFVNAQILADTNASGERTESVYLLEKGVSYAFDGRIDVTFPLEILGPDDSPIRTADGTPPLMVNTPADDGTPRDFFEIKEGGSLVLKNLIISGLHSNGELTNAITVNTGGSKYMADNCVFSDWHFVVFRNLGSGIDISYTNNTFINGVRTSYSVWGGFPMRMDAGGDNVTIENNSMVNTGRLLGNSGPWFTSKVIEQHNTYLNSTKAGHEQRAFEMIQANNIFYNFDFVGTQPPPAENTYNRYFTTWNYFADAKEKLDSISLYMGSNLFYREPEILGFFDANDTLIAGLLWEHPDVDSFITIDDNYTIGANYWQITPDFATPPDNTDEMVAYLTAHWDPDNRPVDWPDWRSPSPLVWDVSGTVQVANWPPAFDLSYADEGLMSAGTDGLPLGDLNWFPNKKAEFMTNRDAIITGLRDSMVNAAYVYDPTTMEVTPLITEITTSVEQISDVIADKFYLENNYPNPFNPSTTIRFGLPQQAKVTLSVFNVIGEKVLEITEQTLAAGSHSFNFDASQLSSGIYVYKMNAVGANGEKFVSSRKMMLLK